MQSVTVLGFIPTKSINHHKPVQSNANYSIKSAIGVGSSSRLGGEMGPAHTAARASNIINDYLTLIWGFKGLHPWKL